MSRIKPVYCSECGGKRLYRSEIQARDGLGRILRIATDKREDNFSMCVFRCVRGNRGWHIGHDPAVRTLIKTMTGREFEDVEGVQ